MKRKLKIILKQYENDKLKQKNLFIFENSQKIWESLFFFLFFLPIRIYVFCVLSLFYFFSFILKAKNKLISIFKKK